MQFQGFFLSSMAVKKALNATLIFEGAHALSINFGPLERVRSIFIDSLTWPDSTIFVFFQDVYRSSIYICGQCQNMPRRRLSLTVSGAYECALTQTGYSTFSTVQAPFLNQTQTSSGTVVLPVLVRT